MSKELAPSVEVVTRTTVENADDGNGAGRRVAPAAWMITAVLGSGLMAAATVVVVVFHAIMFGAASRALHSGVGGGVAAPYLWWGTVESALTAAAAVVLYRLPWRRLTPVRSIVLAGGAGSVVLAVTAWVTFWSTH